MPRWLYGLIATGAAAIVGGISYRVAQTVQLTVVYSLLTWVIAFALGETTRVSSRLEKKVAEWELKVLNLQYLMPYLDRADPYVRDQVRALLDALHDLVRTATKGEMVLKPHSAQRDCIDLLKRVQSENVFATSYIDPKSFWCTPEGALYRQQCFNLVQRGIEITRVFIEPTRADDGQKQCIKDEILKQKTNGVRVRRVLESALPEGCRKDFILIPDKYVGYLGVGKADVVEQLTVCFSKKELNKAKQLAEEILTFSVEC